MKRRVLTEQVLDLEAADWVVRLEDADVDRADAATQAEFFAWVQQSSRHLQAFMDARDAFHELDRLDSQHRVNVRELLDKKSADIIPLRTNAESSIRHDALKSNDAAATPPSRSLKFAGLAAGLIAVGLTIATIGWKVFSVPTYATTFGEQRSFKLDDGSTLYLNVNSKAEIHFSKQSREIRLLKGEALFAVEHDATRPFLVSTDRAIAQAIGTQFNVYRDEELTRVTVVEGVVDVVEPNASFLSKGTESKTNPVEIRSNGAGPGTNAMSSRAPVRLEAGEEARVNNEGVAKLNVKNAGNTIAWRARRLVFRDTPLIDVVAEFNRYNNTRIQVEGEAASKKQLTGIFSADHPQSLLLYLKKDASLAVEQSGEHITIRER